MSESPETPGADESPEPESAVSEPAQEAAAEAPEATAPVQGTEDDDVTAAGSGDVADAGSGDDAESEEDAGDEAEDEDAARPAAEEPAPNRKRRRGLRRGGSEPEAPAEKSAKPTPSRRRARRDPSLPAPVVRAQAKYVRSSARKARLVCDHIRGKSVEEARAILAVTPRAIARDWSKLLESAVANAEHNHELVGEDLYVKAVHADEGPTIKRFRPRAMGRATRIRKRTSHLTILLTPKD